MQELKIWAQGNIGALSFLMELVTSDNMGASMTALAKLERCKSIRGGRIYCLWSDLAGKDIDKVGEICKRVPDSILEDACSRQDYSGRELIASYL